MSKLPCILTIAGSDSGGGAGIQADLKTITMLGGYGASVITALTAQNTTGVTGIHAPDPKFVALQLKTVLEDIRVDAAKTGMLFSAGIIRALARFLSKRRFPLVVDPVCVATSGAKLLEDDAVKAMVEHMFPCADLLTPNIPEAELFSGVEIKGRDDVFLAAERMLTMGPKAVLIKGGHADSLAVTDWFVQQGHDPIPLMQARVDTPNTHGTGCTLSAAVATGLGQGMGLGAAIRRAQEYLNLALRAGFPVGEGSGPPNHLAPLIREQARAGVLAQLDGMARRLVGMAGLKRLVPRCRANVAVCAPFADDAGDVAAFSGGIVGTRDGRMIVAGCPEFGASEFTAQVLLAARRLNPELSCAMTLGLGGGVEDALGPAGLSTVLMARESKPDYVPDEGGSLEFWGVFEAFKEHSEPASIRAVVDRGSMGREPLLRILARDPAELMALLCRLIDELGVSGCVAE